MAHLVQMRQRIKAIETIKKITHAMRLISMSNHARLKGQEEALKLYTAAIKNIFLTIKSQTPTWHNAMLYPSDATNPKPLIILVGSQKGLCGNFNSSIFKLFEHYVAQHGLFNNHYIVIGKKAADYLHDYLAKRPGTIVNTYNDFSSITMFPIAKAVTHEILSLNRGYTHVTFICNKPKTFFLQKAYTLQLIPFSETAQTNPDASTQDYHWEQSPAELLESLSEQYIEAAIQTILFQSLLAEQAARFISMDNSTRNAQSLLEATELLYNKLRQAKITKELTELTGSY